MEPRLFKIVLVTTVILAVVAMSAFPKDHGTGGYQAVNGPTTTFAAYRAALLLTLLLSAAAATVANRRQFSAENGRSTDRSDRSCAMLC